MLPYYAVADVKAAEAELVARLPQGAAMRRAAFAVAQTVLRELRRIHGGAAGRKVWLVVGSGDNGGDALWAGAFLKRRGVDVKALLLAPERAHAAGLAAFRRAGGRAVAHAPLEELAADLFAGRGILVDGVVGLSGRGPLRDQAARLFERMRRGFPPAAVVAVDVPSGVDPDTGAVDGPAVVADVTVAMGVRKPVHALNAAHCGRVELADVGYREAGVGGRPGELAGREPLLRSLQWQDEQLPVPGPDDDKYTQGVVGIAAGSPTYPGAGALCAAGALAMTSGMVRAVGAGAAELVLAHPELVVSEDFESTGRVNAWVVGPGADESAAALLRRVLGTDLPVLADASALRLVPEAVKGRAAPTLITPHDREFEAFAGRPVGADRVAAAKSLAAETGATVLLKGHATVIAAPDGEVWANVAGNSWAATAGSGDVLAGMIGALLAAGYPDGAGGRVAYPSGSARIGADIHSRAADLAAGGPKGAPITASRLAAHIPDAIRAVRSMF